MHGHFDSWGSCICLRRDLPSPGRTKESRLVVEKDEEQSSGRVDEETSSYAVNRDLSNVGLLCENVSEMERNGKIAIKIEMYIPEMSSVFEARFE
jgi:hypothetical protein